jgi:hypothetical protein
VNHAVLFARTRFANECFFSGQFALRHKGERSEAGGRPPVLRW